VFPTALPVCVTRAVDIMSRMGYKLVRSTEWPTGELNGYMSELLGAGIALRAEDIKSSAITSRGIYVLTCGDMIAKKGTSYPHVSDRGV